MISRTIFFVLLLCFFFADLCPCPAAPSVLKLSAGADGKTLVVRLFDKKLDESGLAKFLDDISNENDPVGEYQIVRVEDQKCLPMLPDFFAQLHRKHVRQFVLTLDYK
jgi:hypothetical protein